MTDFDVKVQRGKKVITLPIKAPNKAAAEAHAELLLKRRGGKFEIKGTTEKKQ